MIVEPLGVVHRLTKLARVERNDESLTGDILRTLHSELGCRVSAFSLRRGDVALGAEP